MEDSLRMSIGNKHPHYHKDVSKLQTIDVYRVLALFNVTDPCIQHAVKKLLVAGGRGAGKDVSKDIQESIDSLQRWQEMREEDRSRGVAEEVIDHLEGLFRQDDPTAYKEARKFLQRVKPAQALPALNPLDILTSYAPTNHEHLKTVGVVLEHLPTGVRASCVERDNYDENRDIALEELTRLVHSVGRDGLQP